MNFQPIPKPEKTKKKSPKPLNRSYIKKRLGRVGKLRAEITEDNCAAHHKLKRSLGGKDNLENYLILDHNAHKEIHADPTKLKIALLASANAQNGQRVIK